MASASGIKMGGVFVEIGAQTQKFFAAYNSVQKSLGNLGKNLMSGGGRLAAAGVGMAAPIVAAVKQGANFESTLLNIKASTGATSAEIDKIKSSAMGMSEALGVGPTAAAQGMLELLKAGMSLDDVLGGAGKSALEFAKVGELDVAQAAVVMSDAMNVFGVSGEKAANTLSGAADASSTSIAQMSEAFSMSSAVAGLANQSIDDLSAALAILANNGVKGSDAGTSVKTMLMRLMAPADDAVGALGQLGLSVASFRGADGKMKPLVDIIATLNGAMGGLDKTAKDDIFRRIFGADAIRAASILSTAGVDGFKGMQDAIAGALPVGAKFQTLMSGMAGMGSRVMASLERLAVAISDAVAPALSAVGPVLVGFINGLTNLVRANPEAVAGFAKLAVAAIGVGGAMTGVGAVLRVVAFGMGGIAKTTSMLLSPFATLAKSAVFIGGSFASAVPGVVAVSSALGSGLISSTTAASVATMRAATSIGTLATLAGGQAAAGLATLSAAATRMGASAVASANVAFPVFFTGFNRAMAAGDGFFSAAYRGFRGLAMSSGLFRAALSGVASSGFGKFAGELTTGLQMTYKTFTWWAQGVAMQMTGFGSSVVNSLQYSLKAFTWWASGVGMRLAAYAGSTATAAAASVVNAARSGAAWVAGALPGVLTFVGSAVAGIASYLGAAAAAVAGSVASAAAVAAAWLAPLAPFAALAAAISGAGVLAYTFKDQIGSALGGVGELAGQAGSAIAGTFSVVLSDATAVFGDLYSTATTTFNGIYDAITAGDLSGAMDVLWAGLVAGWLRGTEAIMSYVDPWLATFNNAFTILGAEIYKTWDGLWVTVGNALNTAGAYLMGAMDNIINPILAAWDYLEAGIRKTWIRISGIFKDADEKQRELDAVDADMKGRAEKRAKDRPGIIARAIKAGGQNAEANMALKDRQAAVDANTQEIMQGRLDALGGNAQARRDATLAAEGRLASLVQGQQQAREEAAAKVAGGPDTQKEQVFDLLAAIRGATTAGELFDVGGAKDQAQTMQDLGLLSEQQALAIANAVDKKVKELEKSKDDVDTRSKANMGDALGTFSSLNLGQMFGGTSLAERTAKATEEVAKNTRRIGEGDKVAA